MAENAEKQTVWPLVVIRVRIHEILSIIFNFIQSYLISSILLIFILSLNFIVILFLYIFNFNFISYLNLFSSNFYVLDILFLLYLFYPPPSPPEWKKKYALSRVNTDCSYVYVRFLELVYLVQKKHLQSHLH